MNEEFKKDTLLLFMSVKEIFDALQDEEAGKLIKAAFKYQDGEEPELDGLLKVVFLQIRQQIDYTNAQYLESVKKRSAAGKKGMAHRWDNKNNNVINVNNKNNNVINVNNKNNHNDNVNVNDNDCMLSHTNINKIARADDVNIPREVKIEIAEAWNANGLDKITADSIENGRERMLRARIKKFGLEKVVEVIGKVKESSFLSGRQKNSRWRADLNWLLKPDNFQKVLEGSFDDRARPDDCINDNSKYDDADTWWDDYGKFLEEKEEKKNGTAGINNDG